MYKSYTSLKKFLIPSSCRTSWSMINLICEAVIKENITLLNVLFCIKHETLAILQCKRNCGNWSRLHLIIVPNHKRVSKVGGRICPAVTNADTNHSLNLSTVFKYMLLVNHMFSSTRSKAAWAMNWFRWRWSSWGQSNRVQRQWYLHSFGSVWCLSAIVETAVLRG